MIRTGPPILGRGDGAKVAFQGENEAGIPESEPEGEPREPGDAEPAVVTSDLGESGCTGAFSCVGKTCGARLGTPYDGANTAAELSNRESWTVTWKS